MDFSVKACCLITAVFFYLSLQAQVKWIRVDKDFQPLPQGFHVYKTSDSLDGKPFIAYYAEALLKNDRLDFSADTSSGRRMTPEQFYQRDQQPLLVMNCTFFSYETNSSLNAVIKDGELVAFNRLSIPMKGKDTFQYQHTFAGAIGINKKREADVAWLYTDSINHKAYATQRALLPVKDSVNDFPFQYAKKQTALAMSNYGTSSPELKPWNMQTAVGGGPVLLQKGEIRIANNEELKFEGKAINDQHPRTAMGYTKDGRLIMLVIEGRYKGIAEGATLTQEAQLLKDIGCEEALNLDGGGSSCMLINGKETIKPSEKGEERPVPAVFLIRTSQCN